MTAGGSSEDDLTDFARRRRRPAQVLGYGLVIVWIVSGFLVQLAQGTCPVP